MCDLDANEQHTIIGYVAELDNLVARIKASAQSIEQRNWMEHDELDQLFGQVTVTAGEARGWVQRKVAATHG